MEAVASKLVYTGFGSQSEVLRPCSAPGEVVHAHTLRAPPQLWSPCCSPRHGSSPDVCLSMYSKDKKKASYVIITIYQTELELSAQVHAAEPPDTLYESMMPTMDP